mgnify:FL=1
MGVLTAEEIIREGVQLAGVTYDPTDERPFKWLKDWLRSVTLGWPWIECEGQLLVPLLGATRVITLGGTASYATGRYIHRVLFPLLLDYGSGFEPGKVHQQAIGDMNVALTARVPTGTPDKAGYVRDYGVPGRVSILFNKLAKTNYDIQVKYQWDPAAEYVFASIDITVPWYPNDNTMKQAVAHKAAYYNDGPDAATTGTIGSDLATMLRDDKLKFGVIDQFTTHVNRQWKPR